MKQFGTKQTKLLLAQLLSKNPSAIANISGRDQYANIVGVVEFYDFEGDVVVVATIHNLPTTDKNFFGFHIHENGECDADFESAGGHYGGDKHQMHKGDMPVLIGSGGDAFLVFLTNRFDIDDIIGRPVIIHLDPDDYHTQPSGASGQRIACGIIKRV